MREIVDFEEWQTQRRRVLSEQVKLLEHRTRRTHRPRSPEAWHVIQAWVVAELARRERSGDWVWLDERTVQIRWPGANAS